eukprot:3441233-Amphidinium_carterae.1
MKTLSEEKLSTDPEHVADALLRKPTPGSNDKANIVAHRFVDLYNFIAENRTHQHAIWALDGS